MHPLWGFACVASRYRPLVCAALLCCYGFIFLCSPCFAADEVNDFGDEEVSASDGELIPLSFSTLLTASGLDSDGLAYELSSTWSFLSGTPLPVSVVSSGNLYHSWFYYMLNFAYSNYSELHSIWSEIYSSNLHLSDIYSFLSSSKSTSYAGVSGSAPSSSQKSLLGLLSDVSYNTAFSKLRLDSLVTSNSSISSEAALIREHSYDILSETESIFDLLSSNTVKSTSSGFNTWAYSGGVYSNSYNTSLFSSLNRNVFYLGQMLWGTGTFSFDVFDLDDVVVSSSSPHSVSGALQLINNNLASPLGRLSFMFASESDLEAKQAQESVNQKVIDDFISPSNVGVTIGTLNDLNEVRDLFGSMSTGVSVSEISDVFDVSNEDYFLWFTQENSDAINGSSPSSSLLMARKSVSEPEIEVVDFYSDNVEWFNSLIGDD